MTGENLHPEEHLQAGQSEGGPGGWRALSQCLVPQLLWTGGRSAWLWMHCALPRASLPYQCWCGCTAVATSVVVDLTYCMDRSFSWTARWTHWITGPADQTPAPQVVLVSLNFRLSVLGGLYLPGGEAPGNQMMRDQVQEVT